MPNEDPIGTATQHQVREYPKELPANLFSGAFGHRLFEKIAETLAGDDSGLKRQALQKLEEALFDKNNVHVVQYGVFPVLVATLKETDDQCRLLATQALAHWTTSQFGRETSIKHELVLELSALLGDSSDAVRLAAYPLLVNLVGTPAGLQGALNAGIVTKLIGKANTEALPDLKAAALSTVTKMINDPRGGCYKAAFEGGIVNTLVAVLGSCDAASAQAAALGCMAYVAVAAGGKTACVEAKAMPLVTRALGHDLGYVRKAASSAIMHLTNAQEGKLAAVHEGAVQVLLGRIGDSEDLVVANSLQALANVSEHPASRADGLLAQESTLESIQALIKTTKAPMVRDSAKCALQKVTWKP